MCVFTAALCVLHIGVCAWRSPNYGKAQQLMNMAVLHAGGCPALAQQQAVYVYMVQGADSTWSAANGGEHPAHLVVVSVVCNTAGILK